MFVMSKAKNSVAVVATALLLASGCGPGGGGNDGGGSGSDTMSDTGVDTSADTTGDRDTGGDAAGAAFRGIEAVEPQTLNAAFPTEVKLQLDYRGELPEDAEIVVKVGGEDAQVNEGPAFIPQPHDGRPGRYDVKVTIDGTSHTLKDGLGFRVPLVGITAGRQAPVDLAGVDRVHHAWSVDFNDDDTEDVLAIQPPPTPDGGTNAATGTGQWSVHLLEKKKKKTTSKKVVKFKPGAELADKVKMAGPGDKGRNPQTGKEIKIPAKKTNGNGETDIDLISYAEGKLAGPKTLHSFGKKTTVVDYLVTTWTDPDNGKSSPAVWAVTKKQGAAGTTVKLHHIIEGRRPRTIGEVGSRHPIAGAVDKTGVVRLVANEASSKSRTGADVYLTWMDKDPDLGSYVLSYVAANNFNSTRSNDRDVKEIVDDGNSVRNPEQMQARILDVSGDGHEDLVVGVETDGGATLAMAAGTEKRQDGKKEFMFQKPVPVLKGQPSTSVVSDLHVQVDNTAPTPKRSTVLAGWTGGGTDGSALAAKDFNSTRSNHRNIIIIDGGLGDSKADPAAVSSTIAEPGTGGGSYSVDADSTHIRVYQDGRMRQVPIPAKPHVAFSDVLSTGGRPLLDADVATTDTYVLVAATVGGAPKSAKLGDLEKPRVDQLLDWGNNEAYLLRCKCEGGSCGDFSRGKCTSAEADWKRMKLNVPSGQPFTGQIEIDARGGRVEVHATVLGGSADAPRKGIAHHHIEDPAGLGSESLEADGVTAMKGGKKGNKVTLVGFGDFSTSNHAGGGSDGGDGGDSKPHISHGETHDADGAILDEAAVQKTGLYEHARQAKVKPVAGSHNRVLVEPAPGSDGKDEGGRHTPIYRGYTANFEGGDGSSRAYLWLEAFSKEGSARIIPLNDGGTFKASRVLLTDSFSEPVDGEVGRLVVATSKENGFGEDGGAEVKVARLKVADNGGEGSSGVGGDSELANEEITVVYDKYKRAMAIGQEWPCAGTYENCPTAVVAGDLNGDGLADLAAPAHGEHPAQARPLMASDGTEVGPAADLPPMLRVGLQGVRSDRSIGGALLLYGDQLGFARVKSGGE